MRRVSSIPLIFSPLFYFLLFLSSYVYLFISYYFPSWSNYDDVSFHFMEGPSGQCFFFFFFFGVFNVR